MSWLPEFPLIEEPDPLEDNGQRELHEHPPRIVTRDDWDAEDVESEDEERLEDIEDFPLPYIVFMHTRTRPCVDKDDCKLAVKEIQTTHLEAGEPDILYNFLIDTEGFIYIGRGPAIHTMRFPEDDQKMRKTNRKCITVGYIGNGGIEASEFLIQGSASLIALLIDGKYMDDDTEYVWYHQPDKGLPPEERKKLDIEEMIDHVTTEYGKKMFLKEAKGLAAEHAI